MTIVSNSLRKEKTQAQYKLFQVLENSLLELFIPARRSDSSKSFFKDALFFSLIDLLCSSRDKAGEEPLREGVLAMLSVEVWRFPLICFSRPSLNSCMTRRIRNAFGDSVGSTTNKWTFI